MGIPNTPYVTYKQLLNPRRFSLFLIVAMAGCLVWPSVSEAYLYWGSRSYDPEAQKVTEGFGRANNDGTGITQDQGTFGQWAIHLDTNSTHLYFSEGHNIGRSTLNGSEVTKKVIEKVALEPTQIIWDIAVTDEYVYWITTSRIGRAKLNGTEVNNNFITGVDGGHGITHFGSYIYWTARGNPGPGSGSVIGRATTAGAEVDHDFVSGIGFYCSPCKGDIAYNIDDIAATESFLYVARDRTVDSVVIGEEEEPRYNEPQTIVRVKRDGTELDLDFYENFKAGVEPMAIAASDSHVYWLQVSQIGGSEQELQIGRLNVESGKARHTFICTAGIDDGKYHAMYGLSLALDNGYTESSETQPLGCFLRDQVPELRYDSQELFRAQPADAATSNWGDDQLGLWEHDPEGEGEPYGNTLHYLNDTAVLSSNTLLNEEEFEEGPVELFLENLGEEYFYNSIPASGEDYVDFRSDEGEVSLFIDSALLYNAPGGGDVSYGRAIKDEEGKIWLQYWYFFYNNDSSFLGGEVTIGSHEGDWEYIQIGLNENYFPEDVVFAQHESGSHCPWESLEHTPEGGPVAYVSAGTHAMYPMSGSWVLPSGVPLLRDNTDGEGYASTPRPQELRPAEQRWLSWPGHWGGTNPGSIPGEAESPPGPMHHGQWDDPKGFADEALECFENYDPFKQSSRSSESGVASGVRASSDELVDVLGTKRKGKWFEVRYRVGQRQVEAGKLILTVHAGKDDMAIASKIVKPMERQGKVRIENALGINESAVLRASLVDANGERSEVVSVPVG